MNADSREPEPYFAELVRRLRGVAGADVVGVYAGGSYALDAYEPGRSDLDVAAVLATRPPRPLKEEIVRELRHESLPCPARGFEFVLYTSAAVREPTTEAAFELNLNTGARLPFRVDFEPDPNESHWFPIDRDILAQRGVTLFGPPASDVFAELPRDRLLPLLAESLRRQGGGAGRGDDVVLNACRTWMYIEEGVWSSKPDAGAWASPRAALAAKALRARRGEDSLVPSDVGRFVDAVVRLVLGATERDT